MLRSKKQEDKKDIYETNAEPYGILKKNWFLQTKDLMAEYRGAYTDVAYTVCNPKVHPLIFEELNDPLEGKKIMFGTDYYMTEQEKPEKDIYNDFHKTAVETPVANSVKNAWDLISNDNPSEFLKSKYHPS